MISRASYQLLLLFTLAFVCTTLAFCTSNNSEEIAKGQVISTLPVDTTAAWFVHGDTVLPGRWTAAQANAYYESRPIPLGANYNPRSTINQLEFWQEETFPLAEVREELGWAAGIGMNSMRVYLHDLAWTADSTGFLERVDQYLYVADSLGISTTLVLWDAVWNPVARIGPQPVPRPHIHNSGWVQSPSQQALTLDQRDYPRFERYVKSVLRRFADDERVYLWDLYNEPDNDNFGKFPQEEVATKADRVFPLLVATFGWAREVAPIQPMTAGVWRNQLTDDASLNRYNRFQLNNSDIISFHHYGSPEAAEPYVALSRYGRPLVCTEYVARGENNSFETILPIWAQHDIGAYNWGLVDGKTQTKYPWHSWDSTYTDGPAVWHHEVFHPDGRPYAASEAALIREVGQVYLRGE